MKRQLVCFLTMIITLIFSSCVRISNLSMQVWEQGQQGKGVYLLPQENCDMTHAYRVPQVFKANDKLYVKGIRTEMTRHTPYSNSCFNCKQQYILCPNSIEETVYIRVKIVTPGNDITPFIAEVGNERRLNELPRGAKQIPNRAIWGNPKGIITMKDGRQAVLLNTPELESTPHALYATPLTVVTGAAVDIPVSLAATTVTTAYVTGFYAFAIPTAAVCKLLGIACEIKLTSASEE